MSDQYLPFTDVRSSTEGDDGQPVNTRDAGVREDHLSEAGDKNTNYIDFDIPDQDTVFEDNAFFTGNVDTDFSYNLNAIATASFEGYEETRYSTDFSQSDETPQFADGPSFPGGGGEQFSLASGAGVLDDAAHNAKTSSDFDMTSRSAADPQSGYNYREQSGYNYQDAPPSGGNHDIGPPNPNESNELPSQTWMKPKNTKWEQAEDEALLQLYEQCKSYDKVGEVLHRTYGSCLARRHRLVHKKKNASHAAAPGPNNVPLLRMKDASQVNSETNGQKNIDHVDWATPGVKDKSLVDLKTPGLKEWVHERVKSIQNSQKAGPWIMAWDLVAEDLNKVNQTNLKGNDLVAAMPYQGIQVQRRKWTGRANMGSRFF